MLEFFKSLNVIKFICRFSYENDNKVTIYNLFQKKETLYAFVQNIKLDTPSEEAESMDFTAYSTEHILSLPKENCMWFNVPIVIRKIEESEDSLIIATNFLTVDENGISYNDEISEVLQTIDEEQLNKNIKQMVG